MVGHVRSLAGFVSALTRRFGMCRARSRGCDPSDYFGAAQLSWFGDLGRCLPRLSAPDRAALGARPDGDEEVIWFGLAFGLGVYLGPAVADLWLGPKAGGGGHRSPSWAWM